MDYELDGLKFDKMFDRIYIATAAFNEQALRKWTSSLRTQLELTRAKVATRAEVATATDQAQASQTQPRRCARTKPGFEERAGRGQEAS